METKSTVTLKQEVNNLKELFNEARSKGNLGKALEHAEKISDLNIQLFEITSREKTEELISLHKLDLAKKEADFLKNKNIELMHLNKKLKALHHDKNEFLGIAAHDLKNPLASIALISSTLKLHYDKYSEEDFNKRIDKIETASARMQEIVKHLLDIEAIESGKFSLNMKPQNILPVLKASIDGNEHLAVKKNIKLSYNLSLSDIICEIDSLALSEVFDNLISNSIKYSPFNSEVQIEILEEEKNLKLNFKDNGEGIAKEQLPKLFKKFSTAGSKTTDGESSTGLGLSIVKKLVTKMNGDVFCESEIGRGSNFFIVLPKHIQNN